MKNTDDPRKIKEKTLMDLWKPIVPIETLDNGIDYRIITEGIERKLEIKTSAINYKATFKADDLISYINQDNSSLLLFIGTGRPRDEGFPLKGTEWALLNSYCMEKITKIGLYSERDFRFGYKSTFMITIKQMTEQLGLTFLPLFDKITE